VPPRLSAAGPDRPAGRKGPEHPERRPCADRFLDGVCCAQRNVDGVTLPDEPRIVGALKWAVAAEPNFGFDDGEVFKAYQDSARETSRARKMRLLRAGWARP
jgi:hypothetical protein